MAETTYYKYISNGEHYQEVVAKIPEVKHHLWIGTADIKDLYVKSGSTSVPFLKVISQLIERGVEVRLIHAKEPGPNFRKDFDDYPILAKRLERVLCPRVHFKKIISLDTPKLSTHVNLHHHSLLQVEAGSKGC